MENLLLLLTASLVLYKSSKKPRTVSIGDTRCSVLFFSDPVFETSSTEEGDTLYFSEHTDRYVTYGVLCAQLHEPLPLSESRELLVTYIDRLQKPFNALYNTGITPCMEWTYTDDSSRVVDYWQDSDGLDWKVKGYTDGQIITVLYVRNINEVAVEKQDLFLDSFCFSE